MKRSPAVTHRPWLAAAVGLSLLVTTSCSSTDDGTATAAPQSAGISAAQAEDGESAAVETEVVDSEVADSEVADSESADEASVEESEPADDSDSDSGDSTGLCDLISVDDINAAVGTGDFVTASDISVNGEACLYSSATQVHGITINVDSLDVYLGGDIAGDTDADSLANWASAQEIFVSDAVTTAITVGGIPAVQVTGKSAIQDSPVASAGLITNGKIISVSADGATLSEDPAELGDYAAAVLEVALAKAG